VFESWQSDQPGAESTDPAIKRLFDFPADAGPAFTDIATRVYGPLMDCLEKTA
jgi:hypothetical protein